MRSTAYGANNSGKAITIVLCLGIVCAAIWAATSDKAGEYISNNFIEPLFSKNDIVATDAPTSSTATDAPAQSSQSLTVELDFPSQIIYGLQVGAFSSLDNAKSAIGDITCQGGAGYIITHGGYHKLYSSAYKKETDALIQKAYLLSQNYDVCITPITIEGLLLDITATQEQIDIINNAHTAWINSSDTLFQLSNDFKEQIYTAGQVHSSIEVMQIDISQSISLLQDYKDLNDITINLYDNLSLCNEQLLSYLDASLSNVEVSSSIKYLMIDFIYRFGQYANEVTA